MCAAVNPAPRIEVPKLSLPSGGGAIRALGSGFVTNENLGTGTLILPLDLPVARDLTLELSVDYDSGGGNGLFALGFAVNIPSFGLNTAKGIPRYDGDDPAAYNGDDLVPTLLRDPGGAWVRDVVDRQYDGATWQVTRYQPRVEADFALIEFWRDPATNASHWRTVSSDNVTSLYGSSAQSRIADPDDPTHVVEWLIAESENAKGDRIRFHYRPENRDNLPDDLADRRRSVGANRYPDRIEYGNYTADGVEHFAYEVEFDYGGRDLAQPDAPPQPWPVRCDPFSTYVSGFERRWCRLCHGILVHVSVPELFGGRRTLIRAYRLGYDQQRSGSLLTEIEEIGYRWQADGSFARANMPALRLGYSQYAPRDGRVHTLTTAQGVTVAPGPLAPGAYQLVDLAGEGLPGVLLGNAVTTMYWPPDGDGRFGSGEEPRRFPTDRSFGTGEVALMDVEADGQLDLVVTAPTRAGYYPNDDGAWRSFRAFEAVPTALARAGGQFVDLGGNGLADFVLFQRRGMTIFPSEGTRGFAPPRILPRPFPYAGPDDPAMTTLFADMFGDGLQHWVVVRDGAVECWPSLGRGRFGSPVAFDNAPCFGGGFDARRVRLADTDGSGTTDLLYIHPDRIDLYRNLSGNGFSEPIAIALPATYATLDQISFADVLGTGCAGMVFTASTPDTVQYFYDFGIDGSATRQKPYLMVEIDNNLGALTRIQYRSSTAFYLDDKRAGRPWLTRLPFPVQVVGQVEVLEQVTKTRLLRSYRYHDGYFDSAERAFQGFGFVERRDSANFEDFAAGGLFAAARFDAGEAAVHTPPALAKTWYDVGAYDPNGDLAAARTREYFNGDPDAYDMPGTIYDPAIWSYARPLLRQAQRATKGRVIREEIYGEDGLPNADVPFKVTQSRFMVQLLQPDGPNVDASFFAADCETIIYDYEREADDPRVSHSFSLVFDAFGNIKRDCAIFYPRRPGHDANGGNPAHHRQPEQDALIADASLFDYINDTTDKRWLGVPCERRAFKLAGIEPSPSGYFSRDLLAHEVDAALSNQISYGAPFPPATRAAQLRSWDRTYFWNEAQTDALPLGKISPRGLEHHVANAVFPDGLLDRQRLFEADAGAIPALNQGQFPQALRDVFARHGIAMPDGARSAVTVLTPDQRWLVTDSDIGQVYPIEAIAGPRLGVDRRVFGDLAAGLPELGGYAPIEGYWWNRGSVAVYFTVPERYYELQVVENLFAPPGSSLRRSMTLGYDAATLHVTSVSEQLSDSEQNVTRLEMDYQALQPARVTDPNLIVNEALYDPLAQVLATSLHKGADGDKPLTDYHVRTAPTFADVVARPHYYLQDASSFAYQDVHAWSARRQPASVITLTRETHVSDQQPGQVSAVQINIAFSDGLARQIEIKRVSDPGEAVIRAPNGAVARTTDGRLQVAEVATRWWVSGRTVFNNKGLPVKAYLPYFSNVPEYEDQADVDGLLPPPTVMHYDAMLRATRRDTPKDFFSLNVYHAWTTWLYDEDDTVKQSKFYRDNINNPNLPPDERDALDKAAIFEDTPNALVLDPAARAVRRVQMLVEAVDGAPGPPRYLTTRLTLDDDGVITAIADPRLMAMSPPRDNVQRLLNMTGDILLDVCVDSGTRARLADIYDHDIRQVDGRGVEVAKSYDRLQRLIEIQVRTAGTDPTPWWVAESLIYGEGQAGAIDHNLRGQLYRDRDQGGQLTYPDYNIQGQPVTIERLLTQTYASEVDWSSAASVALEPEPLTSRFSFDALRRVVQETAPDLRQIRSSYGPSSLLASLTLADGTTTQPIVSAIEHDASDQRIRVTLGNQVVSRYDYEQTTLRLVGIHSERSDAVVIQDRSYAYDPVGNVTRTRNKLQPTTFFRQEAVEPLSDYTTDSLYRLIRATGVQQPALAVGPQAPWPAFDPRDGSQLENYLQTYLYDNGSNLTETRHAAASGNWTRRIAIAPLSNRGFPVDGAPATYDRNGNTTSLGGLSGMDWSWRNGLLAIATIDRGTDPSDGAVYQYDARGRRLRKTIRRKISATEDEFEETAYIGDYQRRRIYRESGGERTLILERHDLRVLDDIRYGEAPAADDAPANRDSNRHENMPVAPRSDGRRCYATVHRWTLDAREREIASTDRTLTRYSLITLLGSLTLDLDDAGAVASEEEYYPYGDTAVFSAVSPDEKSLKEYRYVGKERDAATGLYYFGARYYAPWLGRWISPDPAGFNDGTNLYLYVGANPVSSTDPTGLGPANPKKKVTEWKAKVAQYKSRMNKYKTSKTDYGKEQYAEAKRKLASAEIMLKSWEKKAKGGGGAIPTVPAYWNPGGPLVLLQPADHHGGTSRGTVVPANSVPDTAYVADLHKTRKTPLTAQDASDVRNYTMIANRYIQSIPAKKLTCVATNRGTSGGIGAEAEKIAKKERKLNPNAYFAMQVVGHVPDAAATGLAFSPMGWFNQTKRSNSIVGGGLSGGRVITEYLVKESDGNVYRYT